VNAAIRRFPGNLIAGQFGFEAAEYLEAPAGSEQPPEVKF
jgi:LemA protein